MSDLVERLRYLSGSANDRVLTREAADRIEELEARVEGLADEIDALDYEIKELRGEA